MGAVENVCPWVKKVLGSVEKYKISKVKQNNKHITPLLTPLEIARNTPTFFAYGRSSFHCFRQILRKISIPR